MRANPARFEPFASPALRAWLAVNAARVDTVIAGALAYAKPESRMSTPEIVPAYLNAGDFPHPRMTGGKLKILIPGSGPHYRRWTKGDIVAIQGEPYKLGEGKWVSRGTERGTEFPIVPVTAEQFATRKVRALLSATTERAALLQVGNAIPHDEGYMLVADVTHSSGGSAGGSYTIYRAVGPMVSAERAERARAKWEKAQNTRTPVDIDGLRAR